ncbi:MAG: hypothetical protein RLZZ367_1392 [Bacteroidota bacterium]|jgi:hypothetical protein
MKEQGLIFLYIEPCGHSVPVMRNLKQGFQIRLIKPGSKALLKNVLANALRYLPIVGTFEAGKKQRGHYD